MPGRSLMDLRAANRRAVTTALAEGSAETRADLARVTGLSPATVSSLVAELVAAGVVEERPDPVRPHKGGSGRPPVRLALAVQPGHVAAVDVGHRHLRAAVADRSGRILEEAVEDADSGQDGARTLDRAARLLEELSARAGVDLASTVGATLCLPGPVDRSARTAAEVLPAWRDLDPAAHLAARLGVPVHVDNDANLGAVGEHRHGAGAGADDVLYVKVSGGVGAGLVLSGRLHRGSTGIAGELGHVPVRDDGLACRCGSRGCLETEVNVARLLDVLRPAYGDVGIESVLDLEAAGDPGVLRVLGDAGAVLGRVLGGLCTVLNPAVLVVGGTLGASPALVRGLRRAVDRHARPDAAAAVRVRAGVLGDRAEIVGAVTLAVAMAQARPLAD